MAARMMAPELRVERERSSLVLEELTNLLDGGSVMTEKRRRMSENLICHFSLSASLPFLAHLFLFLCLVL